MPKQSKGSRCCTADGRCPDPDSSSKRILLAEDDLAMRTMLAWALRAEGYVVTECGDGGTALAYLLGGAGSPAGSVEGGYDVFVSDVRMPGMTALKVLERLGNTSSLPPTILITAFGDDATRKAARRLGARVVLSKPFELEALIVWVNKVAFADAPSGKAGGPSGPQQ